MKVIVDIWNDDGTSPLFTITIEDDDIEQINKLIEENPLIQERLKPVITYITGTDPAAPITEPEPTPMPYTPLPASGTNPYFTPWTTTTDANAGEALTLDTLERVIETLDTPPRPTGWRVPREIRDRIVLDEFDGEDTLPPNIEISQDIDRYATVVRNTETGRQIMIDAQALTTGRTQEVMRHAIARLTDEDEGGKQ